MKSCREGTHSSQKALSFILVQLASVSEGSKEQPSMNPGQSPRDRLWFWERRVRGCRGTLLLAVPAPKAPELPGGARQHTCLQLCPAPIFFASILY